MPSIKPYLPSQHAATLGTHLFEHNPACMLLVDSESRIAAVNRAACAALDAGEAGPAAGTPWHALWPQEAHAALDAATARARAEGSAGFDAVRPAAGGRSAHWLVTLSTLPAPDGSALLLAVLQEAAVPAAAPAPTRFETDQRMTEVFRLAPAFMCVLGGPQHVFEFVNERYLALVGDRPLLGLPAARAVSELVPQGLMSMLDRVYRTGEPYTATDLCVRLQRTPGAPPEERIVDLVFIALRDGAGRVTGLLGHGVDQTHRKLAEIALHDSRERFEKIVSQAATGVVEMDTSGRITLVNQRFCQMLRYAETELLGRSILDATAPESVAATWQALQGLLADGRGFQIDKHYLRKDGSTMSATSSVNAVRGADGEYQGVVAIVLDTTESKRAAAALRVSQERYRNLFEAMDQAFCIVELEFDGAGRAVDWVYLETNPAFVAQTGVSDAIGRRLRSFVPDPEGWWLDELGEVARTGQARRIEREVHSGDGHWLDVYLTRVGGSGSDKVAVLFRDISERKAADATLRRLADDLAETDRRKTEFLATLAHELRNPLAPIRSGLGVMRLNRDLPAGMTRVREMMERQVTHMVHLIDDLLDVARISGGKLNLRKERVSLNGVLASAVETSLPLIEAAHHALAVDLPDEVLLVDADATRIAQVVSNLLNNAAKYTPAGGRIGLTLREQGGQAVIAVSDTGIGIPAHALLSVFDMFSQVGSGAERAQGGLGIGLSLVRQLVEMHGGSVEAQSGGPGNGSRFTVRLPLAPGTATQHASAGDTAPAAAPDSAGLRVLVVDDNVDAALTLAMILDIEGYATRVAHSGMQALEVAAAFLPAVIFLDIGMPGMDGYDTACALRRMPALDEPCLVALTGWGSEHDRARSREAGFDHHLTKPVDLGTVQQLLAGMAAAAAAGEPPCSAV